MIQRNITASEINAAGGFAKWFERELRNPSPQPPEAMKRKAPKPSVAPVARGRKPADPLMGYDGERMKSDLERKYARYLGSQLRDGYIVFWRYEPITLRLADRTTYTPDFLVMLPDGSLAFYETKGYWRATARAKTKIAAEQYPWFSFVAVQWDAKRKDWSYERFGRKA